MTPPVLRFAPSPNGLLHLGHAYSALMNEAEAARLGGKLLLRIEDIDPTRCRPAFEKAIRDDLAWLGIRFSPETRRQSEHMGAYAEALERLRAMGLIYGCACSRNDVKAAAAAGSARTGAPPPRDPDGALIYPGTCRPGNAGSALRGPVRTQRLAMAAAAAAAPRGLGYIRFWPAGREERVEVHPERWGDVVLARKETPTSYHLSVVVDDAVQGVSHVVRGADLEAQTEIHVLLQALLGLPTPRYQFHPLILDEAQEKLAKSRGSRSLADLRAGGASAAAIRARLGFPARA